MASKRFQRKVREVANQVMEDGEEFRTGLAGQAGQGTTAKAGGWSPGAQTARAGAVFAGKMFNALVILGDRNLYLIRTPKFKAYEVTEVVLKAPRDEVSIRRTGGTRIQVGDYYVTYTFPMESQAKDLLAETGASA
jgi:hypothetical protein